ncbi:TolC family protein [Mucilaginibacter gotjawali]|uniref:Outer membrane protein TolC n=1 Tax=Mucilaginibacter gotjawali TaxID=1550579 RepID=A0A839S930_9SPHI|nr:TolC family protein [Mucilaginibacter gotjawali]MBB3054495.1 outer membrane protein TolC [Mucilaginibacter gotjawali]
MTRLNKHTNLKFFNAAAAAFKRFIAPAIVLILLGFNAVNAQDRVITLDEALKMGLANSNVVKLSKSKIDQAISQYNQAKDNILPTGKASFTYNRAEIPANKLDFGPASLTLPKSADAFLGIASVNEVIYGGNRLKYAEQSTELLAQISRIDAENDKDAVAYDIINQYYNLYKVLKSKKVVEQNLATVDQQIKQAQRFFDQGIVTKNDVLRFQLQRSNIELNGIDLETNRKIVNYNLNILLGLPEGTQLAINDIAEADRPVAPVTAYIDTALTLRTEVRSLDLRSQVAETNVKNIKANALPTVNASAAAYYIDTQIDPFPQSGKYILPLTLGVGVSWNFSTLWTNKNKVAEAKIQQDEVSLNKLITMNNVRREVNEDYQNYMMALDKIKLLQTSIEQAGENNKILESKYKSNIASATDRADAETLLYQAEINLELAKADAGLAYYTLIKSTGKLNK